MLTTRRLLLIVPPLLSTVLIVVLIVVVSELTRACSAFGDTWGRDTRDTSAATLAHYALALPAEAKTASAFESTSFHGPDECFLEFSLPEAQVATYLSGLGAVQTQQSLENTVSAYNAQIDEFHLTDWHFEDPPADYTVYDWHAVTSISDSEGWIVVDRHTPEPTIFVLAATMS